MNIDLYPIKSIDEEREACEGAWKAATAAGLGEWSWCCHHMMHFERLLTARDGAEEGYRGRIYYISKTKDICELAIRYRNFRPIRVPLPTAFLEVDAKSMAANALERELYFEINNRPAPVSSSLGNQLDAARRNVDTLRRAINDMLRHMREHIQHLHNEDWPDNTWDSMRGSIFPSKVLNLCFR